MDDANNHTATFTAADIEKYHKGMLSPKEMHAMEKAALDDPFLADALEGYSVPEVNVAMDIAELKKRLAQKTEEPAKVIPIASGGRSFRWLRAAVLIAGIAGAGLLTYQLAFNNKSEDSIAESRGYDKSPAQQQPPATTGETNTKINATAPDSSSKNGTTVTVNNFTAPDQPVSNTNGDVVSNNIDKLVQPRQLTLPPAGSIAPSESKPITTYNYTTSSRPDSPYATYKKIPDAAPTKKGGNPGYYTDSISVPGIARTSPITQDKNLFGTDSKSMPISDDLAKQKATATAQGRKKTAEEVMAERSVMFNSSTRPTGNIDTRGSTNNGITFKAEKDNNAYYKLNNFRGQVLDNNNNPLPFANVTNVQDGIGTYADSKGYFNLTSTADSQLNVNVRVLGYNNLNYQLKSTTGLLNRVQMQEDRSLSAQVVEKNKRANEDRKSRNTMKLAGEPEPEDGWDNYYSYLDNNTNAPDEALRAKENATGLSVDVSFEVNKYGEPVDIKVERSLCPQCNAEAIRLIQQGPKWKRKAKKGRTTVTISF
jgi:hypothetical protein